VNHPVLALFPQLVSQFDLPAQRVLFFQLAYLIPELTKPGKAARPPPKYLMKSDDRYFVDKVAADQRRRAELEAASNKMGRTARPTIEIGE